MYNSMQIRTNYYEVKYLTEIETLSLCVKRVYMQLVTVGQERK